MQQNSNPLCPHCSSQFVALELLKNANIAAGKILPGCQDTGTAIVMGKRGRSVLTTGATDEEAISLGVYETYTERNLRYSQVAARNMFEEGNTGCNLPAQIDLYSEEGDEYKFMFMAKGGGSANKTFLYQQTKALLNEKVRGLGVGSSRGWKSGGGGEKGLEFQQDRSAASKTLTNFPRCSVP